MQLKYNWAVNDSKLHRAITQSQTKEEEDVKRIYVSLGGKIAQVSMGDSISRIKKVVLEDEDDDDEGPGVTFGVERIAPPKKRGRPAKE